MEKMSVIVPCYNEEESLPLFYNEIKKIAVELKSLEFEFLFIDDGSKDNTLNIIKQLKEKDSRVRYIEFSRNFGKESAIYAGLENSKGDYVVLIDADLQHPPKLIVDMYNLIVNEGYDCVATRRVNRQGEPKIRSFFARQFYKLIRKISDVELVDGAQDFRMMKHNVVKSILDMKEYNRFSKGIFCWVGYKTKWIEHENVERVAGETKWSFWSLFKYSIEGIIGFSTMPLAISSLFGIIFCIISLVVGLIFIIKTLIFGDPVAGFPTLICSIFFIGGIQLFCTGILGQYLAKTYLESKQRPIYIAREISE